MLRYFAMLCFCVFLCGCSITNYNLKAPDKVSKQFTTSYKVKQDEIIKFYPIGFNKYKKLLIVGIKGESMIAYRVRKDFWLQSLSSLGYFQNVIAIEDLPNYLIEKGYGNVTLNGLFDMLALHKLTESYGNFLFAEISADDVPSAGIAITFKIIDPANGKVYFEVQRSGASWYGLDDNSLYPILNAFSNWLRSSNSL
jgi:hypothetical protein